MIKAVIFDCFGVLVGDESQAGVQHTVNQDLFAYISLELKPKYKIGLLSNASTGVVESKIPTDRRTLFDQIIVSGEVGFMKPDPEIFTIAVQRLGVNFTEAVFIDDLERYVTTASEMGMSTIHYQDFETFKIKLSSILKS